MKRKFSIMAVAWMLVLSLFGFSSLASAEEILASTFEKKIQSIVDEKLIGADVSITIRDSDTSEVLYELNGDTTIKPASNMKLLTTAAALDVLGEDYRFATNLYINGKISNGVLIGDVYLQGQGDPTLMDTDLKQFAEDLKSLGIHTIEGRIVGDDKWFDGDLLTPGIWADDESWYYAAPITALTTSPNPDYDSGTIIVDVAPAQVGEPATFTITPHIGDLEIINEAITVPSGENRTVSVERIYQTNQILISGNIPIGRTFRDWITVQNPTTHTLTMFQAILAEAGIEYTKDKVFQAATPNSAQLISTKESMTLKELLIPYMKLSNNGIADILIKTMGKVKNHHGSTNAGLKVLNDYGQSIGLNMNDWFFEDGSGMSHENYVSSLTVSELLYKVQSEEWYDTFLTSLPVSANSTRMVGGTLRNRLKDPLTAGKVFAKTGSLNGVAALSGYIEANSGNRYIFSVLVQNKSGAAPVIDEIVLEIAKEF
ncbi:D-alanyl-D-alanine carboxypeptidase/D-alanyl-D-alanine endopeptidase [Ureibacillus acetophenoni]|uniref:D-alanyl-D-alanine carboxypeptidase/D-alanyl-D-alanine-endopeptidase (Penicillin-binding protein 4) n=1 Tax=Ureibacillus acetophenoni TaxID=614649 RepID=A0A285U7E5_9BACL|nr:D-alanyl-D-alanine carboxypeptidase/D-alanyl-D-alanine-endopeptidase [Ureibacillus acetophenoni]SOC36476.1 D-alanyl-D-alanine carboxypeptidase/D-alanyl-D-alanine-endopeptidase (penicillin-binding protein 4) [Ureibacillus acetophenoni]